MKKILGIILLVMMMGTAANAGSIIATVGAQSNHLIEGDFNEKHDWLGLGYRFIEKDSYAVQVDGAKFVNSYGDDTEFYAVTGIYTPVHIGKIKLGLSGSIGYQNGYYVNKEGTVHPSRAERLGIGDESILLLYTLYGEFDNLVVNYTYVPDSVEAITVGFKAYEW